MGCPRCQVHVGAEDVTQGTSRALVDGRATVRAAGPGAADSPGAVAARTLLLEVAGRRIATRLLRPSSLGPGAGGLHPARLGWPHRAGAVCESSREGFTQWRHRVCPQGELEGRSGWTIRRARDATPRIREQDPVQVAILERILIVIARETASPPDWPEIINRLQ